MPRRITYNVLTYIIQKLNTTRRNAKRYCARATPPMINLNDIQIFVCTARCGTINAAAKSLGVPPSTVSRAISRLEKDVNLLLLRRTTQGITLTDVGRDYYEQCDAALDQLTAAHETLPAHRAKPRGTIRLAVTTAFAREVLTPVLKHFVVQYPEISLQIMLHGGKFSTSLNDDLDFYFQVGKPRDSSLRVKNFPPIRRGIYASPTYLKTHGQPTEPSALREHFCIGYTTKDLANWYFKSEKQEQAVKVALRISVADPVILKNLALDGLGIAQLPVWAALPELEAGKLIAVLPDWQSEPLHFHALYAERSSMAPKVKVFLEFVERFTSTEDDPRSGSYQSSEVFEIS